MRIIIIEIFSVLLFQQAWAQLPSPDDLLSEELSPRLNILVQHYYIESLDRAEIWLIDKHDSSNILLFDSISWRGTSVIFSPDQEWIAENVEVVSNFREIQLFKRTQGIHYSEIKDADIYNKVLKLFSKVEHLSKFSGFGHSMVKLVSWLPNSKAFLISLIGWDNEQGISVGDWSCLFDVNLLTATLDFNKLHQGVVKRNH